MNYDNIAVSKDPDVRPIDLDPGNPSERDLDQDFKEPDCAPHPLDVMAIYALYQTN